MFVCKTCGKEFEEWRIKKHKEIPKFCSVKCCNNRIITEEERKKISDGVKKHLKENPEYKEKQRKIQNKIKEKHASFLREQEAVSILELSKRTVVKIMVRTNKPCSKCGWYVKGVVSDIHHIISKKNGGSDDMDNLSYICPNCHRLVHSGIIHNNELVNLMDYIGDTWKNFYYVKNNKIHSK